MVDDRVPGAKFVSRRFTCPVCHEEHYDTAASVFCAKDGARMVAQADKTP